MVVLRLGKALGRPAILPAPNPIIEVGYTYHFNVKVALEPKAADLTFIRNK